MIRADRKNAVLRKTRLKFQQQIAAAGRPLVRDYEALSKTRYNSVRISNFGLKFLQYILNILYFRIKRKKNFDFFNLSYQTTTLTRQTLLRLWYICTQRVNYPIIIVDVVVVVLLLHITDRLPDATTVQISYPEDLQRHNYGTGPGLSTASVYGTH